MSRISTAAKKRIVLLSGAAALAIWLGAFAFQQFANAQEPAGAQAQAPAVAVSVETVKAGDVRVWSEFSGRLNAVDYAEIRPEVTGRIVEVRFKDGQMVKAGDILFVIDPRPFQAALAKAEADLATARTNLDWAKIELDRATGLVKTKAIAQSLYDERANNKRVAEAAVQSTEALVMRAKIDVDRAFVKAPIAGRVSRPEITLGNVVLSGLNAPLLTSIASNDGIYADFEVDEQTYLRSVRAEANTSDKERHIPIEMKVQSDKDRTYNGTIYSFDNRISSASGTIRARGRFDNKDATLMPGMFVTVKLGSGMKSQALLVPDRAIGNDQSKKFLYVVGSDNKVAYREVALGQEVEGKRIVLSGLKPGERVIVNGLQHVAPNVTVQPTEETSVASVTPAR